ncbi:hypothetical protein H7169_02955 [Candidatus Gracilibacteria bacterium]|nr:hypothetical protein [Candidatus Gracilibacteria bacterium]
MSGGHDDHGHSESPKSSGGGPSHSVTKGAAGIMTGMFSFLFNGIFDSGGGGHDHH